jgi:hypothetical protein
MLVDRMARMLRRSAHVSHDWESGGTGVGSGAARGSAPDLGSGPVRAQTPGPQQWGQGSDPAASPWNAKSNPSAQPWHGATPSGDASQPFARPINDGSQPYPRVASDESSQGYVGTTLSTRKRRWPLLLILLAGLAAGGAAIALAMSGGHDAPATTQAAEDTGDTVELKAEPVAPAPTQTASDPAPAKAEPSEPGPTQTASEPAQPTAVPGDRGDATPSDEPTHDPKKVIVDTKSNPRADKKAVATKRGTSRPVKTVKTDRTQKAGANASSLIDPNGDATKDANKPAEKRCDVWNSMHGCASK